MRLNRFPTARELTNHRTNGVNEALRVFVLDQPVLGGACHEYAVLLPMSSYDAELQNPGGEKLEWSATFEIGKQKAYTNRADSIMSDRSLLRIHEGKNVARMDHLGCSSPDDYDLLDDMWYDIVSRVPFQNGPVKEAGVNGLTNEVLLAILIDRMEGFQGGQFKCHDNQLALDAIQTARLFLHKRTLDRVARNVEGTLEK